MGQRDGEVRHRMSCAVHSGLSDPEAAQEFVADAEEAQEEALYFLSNLSSAFLLNFLSFCSQFVAVEELKE